MPTDVFEILDISIVVLLDEPIAGSLDAGSLLEGENMSILMKKPLSYNQTLLVDPSLGGNIAHQFESMRSQKTISISPHRLEVHDKSGTEDLERSKLPEIMSELLMNLALKSVKAIGANIELTFSSGGEESAAKVIKQRAMQQNIHGLPENTEFFGGSVRLFLAGKSDMTYNVAVEPRLNDPITTTVWMTCNANLATSSIPDLPQLHHLLRTCQEVVYSVKRSLFEVAS